MAFLPQGQSKLSVIMRCPYKVGVRKAGFDCINERPFECFPGHRSRNDSFGFAA